VSDARPTTAAEDHTPAGVGPGVVLLVAAAVALVAANTGFAAQWERLWSFPLAFGHDVRDAVNDGLMTIFFFSVGLEIRHEVQGGSLSGIRRAILPLAAAAGGMIVPALIYWTFNTGGPTAVGWGIPVATDIAFAVGVLTLFGKRVPSTVRALLLALAVVDDVGAILVITIFYAGGIHPTLGGVILGLALPKRLGAWLQRALAIPVSYVIMPLFALANAGVTLDASVLSGPSLHVVAGVALGLVVGKPIGVLAAANLLVSTKVAELPPHIGRRQLGVLGALAGIGFTMSLFIAQLAFKEEADAPFLAAAKLGIISGSLVAAALAAAITLFRRRRLP
jgi:NhaA family Na+:H+ antiporter